MAFDPVSYLIGKAAGGGGGGSGGNAWASLDVPSASVGTNGDYYFQLSTDFRAISSDFPNSASNTSGGWEFTAVTPITIVGIAVFSQETLSGKTVSFGTTDGTVLKSVTMDLVSNTWVNAYFDDAVTLEAGKHYVILLSAGISHTLKWSGIPTLSTDKLTYVSGRTGTFPGTQENSVAYSVDVLIQVEAPPYKMFAQYYKTGGVWVEV